MYGRYLLRRPHDPDYEVLRRLPEGLFLDIGANSGMSALSARTVNPALSILSVEANPAHEPDLRALSRVLSRFDYRIVAAGDHERDVVLHIPTYRGVALTGEASVLPHREADLEWWIRQHAGRRPLKLGSIRMVTRERPLDSLGVRPVAVKIDVEGFELPVLRGLAQTLAACTPLLLLERPDDLSQIESFLKPYGYQAFSYDPPSDRIIAFTGRGTNVLFVADPRLVAGSPDVAESRGGIPGQENRLQPQRSRRRATRPIVPRAGLMTGHWKSRT